MRQHPLGAGAAGAPCPVCNRTDQEDPTDLPAMPPGFVVAKD